MPDEYEGENLFRFFLTIELTGIRILQTNNMFDIRQALSRDFAIDGPQIHHNLSKNELFRAALANDRGRVVSGGGYNDRKAHATVLKEKGPLVFVTDPDCTGRPVDDTYAVAWPEVESTIWWKPSLQAFDPDKYEQLLPRVISHLNEYAGPLYVQDVIVGHDSAYAIPYRFVGQYASHAFFTSNMFVNPAPNSNGHDWSKSWTMLNVQTFECDFRSATDAVHRGQRYSIFEINCAWCWVALTIADLSKSRFLL